MGIGRFALPLGLAGVAAGILAADLEVAPPLLAVGGAAIAALGLGALIGPSAATGGGLLLIGVFGAFGAFGAWRQATTDPSRPTDIPSVAILVDGDEHEMVGTVMDDPRPREDRMQLVLGELVVVIDSQPVPLADRLLVWMHAASMRAAGTACRFGRGLSWRMTSMASRTANIWRARASAPSGVLGPSR
ncbi:MAG: hypothetical protein ACR2GO_08325 [Candidatus Limnocylindria bacterium]